MTANEAERRRWNEPSWVAAWPKREVLTDAITPYLLDALALQPGERVLDIGCGGGKATIAAARAVGPAGHAVGADISGPLTELAARRAAEAGVDNVSFCVADVQVEQTGRRAVRRRDEPVRRDVLRRRGRGVHQHPRATARRAAGSRSRAGRPSTATRGSSAPRSPGSFPRSLRPSRARTRSDRSHSATRSARGRSSSRPASRT